MQGISDTIARLAALRAQHDAHTADPGTPDQLQTLTNFGSNPGTLKARCYLPKDLPTGAPLVVILHGCTQNAAAYDHHSGWSQLADEAGFALLYPEQQRANNPNLCFNWFLPNDTSRDSGEALSIREMVEAMVVTHGLDGKRIFVTGLSAGGAMAAAMLGTYPEVFAGGAIIAGLPSGSATTIPAAFDRMRGQGGPSEQDLERALRGASDHRGPWPRISIWHGTADHTVAPSNAEAIADQWRRVHELDVAPTYSKSAGRHAKRVWCDVAGEAVIEINMITGMGHGTPLGDGLGSPGPYMLDVGISSTQEIARFWGISATGKSVFTRSQQEVPASQRPLSRSGVPHKEKAKTKSPEPTGIHLFQHLPASGAPGVKKIIEDALRAAGLMR
ncbi:PHB depolymerase family esterase [Mesorhizobium sp. BAC0120]|uniref:extracellular catalytic domain type 1 short-chain-length polyhydroxyalkanoate depolymerase n=1 Tax=Mesorhizobium sp. BAC0120 TaxID=3090670 RepID=UPI00298BF446|nr:PHB depolymerase family esterase [Mesorhizobium sp. BAC0120]MDW6026513.1 PHB depolymerase family esterase [Mesorhizobium sp. BAC0120]